jgi:hypothetical protein
VLQYDSYMYAALKKCIQSSALAAPLLAGASLAAPVFAQPCTGPGAPTTTETECLTAVQIPGNPLRSFDISWVNPTFNQYYLGDRSNAGIDVVNTVSNTFKLRLTGFVGIVLNSAGTAVNNAKSGPDGVTAHGRWVYGGDGDSTLKVFNIFAVPTATNGVPGIAPAQSISTGGKTRLDEMALTSDGKLLLAANNAEDPPFATLFTANGDSGVSNVKIVTKITVDPQIIPTGFGLSIEQPTWEPKTARFYVSIPVIANNPTGCNYGQIVTVPPTPINCDGGMAVIDPTNLSGNPAVLGAFDPMTNTGVVPLNGCGPNGATVGPGSNLLLGCTPANDPSDTTTLVINAKNKNYSHVFGLTGSDEVWFNSGDQRYYTGSSREEEGTPPTTVPSLGVVDGTSVLIETIPQGSGSHSVAADCNRNRIYVPQVAPVSVVGSGGDTTGVSAGICGTMNGCVGVYVNPTIQNTACGAIYGNTGYYNAK